MKHGVGITTRNRPHVLKTALDFFAEHHTNESMYVIVDDNSDAELSPASHVQEFEKLVDAPVVYVRSGTRLGIASAKNVCLHYLKMCDNVFLFDDDAWPITNGWADKWADASAHTGVEHSMMIEKLNATSDFFKVTSTAGAGEHEMLNWTNCCGCVLHFTKNALTTIGGYDTDKALNVYGYEHAQMSMRCQKAGLTQGMKYASPKHVSEWVYAVDINWHWFKKDPPKQVSWLNEFKSSVTQEEAKASSMNSNMMKSTDIHIPIVNPLKKYPSVDVIIPCKVNFDGLSKLVRTLKDDPAVGEVVVVADGDEAESKISSMLSDTVVLLTVPIASGIHKMWNMGIDKVVNNGRHIAIINDDVTLSSNAMSSVSMLMEDRPDIGLVSPSDRASIDVDFFQTTGFAGFCMVVASDLIKDWRFDERMMWWYGDNDIITWVHRSKKRKTGMTALATATGNESKTIRTSPPPDFHKHIQNDADLYREKWGPR